MAHDKDEKISGVEATLFAPGAEPSSPSVASPLGHRLGGRYDITGLIGVGGMGSVYRARDTELDEVVALKMLSRDFVDTPGMLARFRQEVKLARRVTHLNVARTYDIGDHENQKFLTMEFIDGESLANLIEREGALSARRTVELALPICAGLDAAHAAGVIHRDLKPDNVLVARDGRVVITDFGIARSEGSRIAMTQGAPIGTPAYMSPEQVEGSPNIDARTDIYALGVMLYELLTGTCPWEGDSVYAVAAARLVHPPPDPRERRRSIPDAMAAVVVRCMQRRPEDRFTNAREVSAALETLVLHAPSILPAPELAPMMVSADDPGAEHEKTVAVLPFRASRPDDYLAEGLTDDLIDALSMTPGLRVRSRGAIIHLKGNSRDPRELGRELEVQVVVDGSLRRVGDNVRVSARLISVAEGFQLWAKRFECPSGDVLRVGDEAAGAIAEALTVRRVAVRLKPSDPIVVDLYLQARHEYHKSLIDPDNKAIALFAQAYERAPDDPMILSGYAMALLRRFGIEEGQDVLGDVALEMAERALAIAPEMAEAKLALARVRFNMGDPLTAMKTLGIALRESPGLAEAHDIVGRVLIEVGRPAEGAAHLKKATELDPLVNNFGGEYARIHALRGEWEKCDALLVDIPEDVSHLNFYWLTRVRLAIWKRDRVYAAHLLEKIMERPFTVQPIAVSICQLIIQGEVLPDVQRAILMGARASGRATRRRAFFCQLAAEVSAYLGAEDDALSAMEDSVDAKLIDIFWLDHCPLFDTMRSHPRFIAVRKTVDARAKEILACFGMA